MASAKQPLPLVSDRYALPITIVLLQSSTRHAGFVGILRNLIRILLVYGQATRHGYLLIAFRALVATHPGQLALPPTSIVIRIVAIAPVWRLSLSLSIVRVFGEWSLIKYQATVLSTILFRIIQRTVEWMVVLIATTLRVLGRIS